MTLNCLLLWNIQNPLIIFISHLNMVSFDQEELKLVLLLNYMVNFDPERLNYVTLYVSLVK